MPPTFVLVHGSNGNSFSWSPLQRELALLGHRSLAVDLPGHGFEATYPTAFQTQDAAALAEAPSGMAGRTLADNVTHLSEILRRLKTHGPTIVLAHSRGGATLTPLGNAVPELIDRMVYMSAWCSVDLPIGEYTATPEYATSVLGQTMGVLAADPAEVGAIRMNWRTADPALLAALKLSMAAEASDDEFLTFLGSLQPDEGLDAGGEEHRAQAATWGTVPRTYVRLTEDLSMPLALQDRFIAEADALTPDNRFDVRTLEASHVGPLLRPRALASILASLA